VFPTAFVKRQQSANKWIDGGDRPTGWFGRRTSLRPPAASASNSSYTPNTALDRQLPRPAIPASQY